MSTAATMSSSINADKVRFTGRKLEQKIYYKHTGYPGGIKEVTAGKVLEGRFPERVLEKAVERMIPRGPLGRDQMRALHLYNGTEHPHGGQDPASPRRRVDEPQEQGGRIMADKKSLSDLGELTNPKPEARAPLPKLPAEAEAACRAAPKLRERPPRSRGCRRSRCVDPGSADRGGASRAAARQAWPRLCDRPPQGRRRARLAEAGLGQDRHQRPRAGNLFRAPDAAPDHQPGVRRHRSRGQYDVEATVKGGGLSGQAGAVRHGISTGADPLRAGAADDVKREGFLTRDPRVVERKKYGRAKARRSFQFSKR